MRADKLQYNVFQICAACDGERISGATEAIFTGISTDSRDIRPGDLFVPLRGENFNGFDYVIPALEAGASGSLVDSDFSDQLPKNLSNHVLIKVQDTLRSLTDLASTHRILFPIPLIAVTGSSGKTTVKEMIASILSTKNRTLATKGNFNNLIGLPMTVLSISGDFDSAVVEAGINRIGEMDWLARAANPDVAVISTIGPVHLEGLKNIATVAREKFKLVQAATKAGVVPFGIPEIDALAESHPGKLFSFGMDGGDFRASKITFGDGTHFLMDCPWGSRKITVHVPGRHNIANALAAAAACLNLGSGLDEIAHGLEILEAPSWRMETVKFGHNHVLIKDYYNANPQSMRAALETLADFDSSSATFAILGDMMELGELSETLHRDLGKFAALLKINKVIFIGQKGRFFGEGYKSVCGSTASLELFDDKDSAWEAIKSEIGAHDRILVKASRSMKMELIANRILEEI